MSRSGSAQHTIYLGDDYRIETSCTVCRPSNSRSSYQPGARKSYTSYEDDADDFENYYANARGRWSYF